MSKPTTLERRLALSARGCRVTTAVRQHAAAAYELGDLHGLALWLQARARLSRLSPVELQELREMARVLVRQSSAIRRSLEEQLQAAAEQQVPAILSWEERQRLLVQREAQRRAGDRQPVTLVPANRVDSPAPIPSGPSYCRKAMGAGGARLAVKLDRLLVEVQAAGAPEQGSAEQPEAGAPEQHQPMAQAPAAEPAPAPRPAWPISPSLLPATPASAVVAPAPRKRAPRGTCCPRELELPLTLLLQQIQHREDEADWPEDPEFPWELAIATLEELQASGAPEPAMADQHQPEAAAQADLEPEPAEPLQWNHPSHQAIAAAAIGTPPAELSPRARAIAELGAALLLQGGESITISTGAAAELLEALVR